MRGIKRQISVIRYRISGGGEAWASPPFLLKKKDLTQRAQRSEHRVRGEAATRSISETERELILPKRRQPSKQSNCLAIQAIDNIPEIDGSVLPFFESRQ